MRDLKADFDLTSPDNWPHLPIVAVPGDSSAVEWPPEAWSGIVVLKVSPPDADFLIAFKNGGNMQYLRRAFSPGEYGQEDGLFGMRRGPGDVEFTVLPPALTWGDELKLEMVELTTIDDPKYPNLVIM
jgi:hypothetical protein